MEAKSTSAAKPEAKSGESEEVMPMSVFEMLPPKKKLEVYNQMFHQTESWRPMCFLYEVFDAFTVPLLFKRHEEDDVTRYAKVVGTQLEGLIISRTRDRFECLTP